MALAPFFDRVSGAVGGHLAVSRDSLVASLSGVTAGVRCGPSLGANDSWIAEFTTNLLARLYPRLAISASEPLCSTLRTLARDINPDIEFVETAPASTSICVGGASGAGGLFPSASGWVANLEHRSGARQGPPNPYAAAAAAAFATAELFR